MLSPEYLAQLPEPVLELWRQVEDDILADMARRIVKMDGITETAGLDITQTALRLRKARGDLRQFAQDTGRRADSARVGVHGFGRSQAGKAGCKIWPFDCIIKIH